MKNPQWNDRESDDLTGSPELFATNLLLVRAIDNSVESVTMTKETDRIAVQLFAEDRDYEPETLTEDTDQWSTIKSRFQAMTNFDENDENEGTLEPNLPKSGKVSSIRVSYGDGNLVLDFHYSGDSTG